MPCSCGCCAGIGIETPVVAQNLPGMSAIAYRTGNWGSFRDSMLARLSSADYPALGDLKTRATDDFSIALLDASAVMLDILTFYQERLANESYLRTATHRRSLAELARLVGYQPAPGVAAETYLAFTLKAATGLPVQPNAAAIAIPAGSQVQSVPAQNQTPQVFETAADILAKADWNALPVQTGIPWTPPGGRGLYLAGAATQLNPGDSLLLLGPEREFWADGPVPNQQWDVVTLNQVVTDTANSVTWVGWDRRMDHAMAAPGAWTTAKVFAFRQKAALFGAAAPDPRLFVNAMTNTSTSLPQLICDDTTPWHWKGYVIGPSSQIDLDSTYPKIVTGSWFALVQAGTAQLYKVASARTVSRSGFALSARVSEIAADYDDAHIYSFGLQTTAVLAQSEQLAIARQPIDHPLYGTFIDIDALRPDLAGVQAIAVFGKAQKLAVAAAAGTLSLVLDEDGETSDLHPADIVTLISPGALPANGDGSVPDWSLAHGNWALRVADAGGRTGIVTAPLASFTLAASAKTDPVIQECVLVTSVFASTTPYPHTRIGLQSALTRVYDRSQSTVNANTGLATAGRSVSEIMGSGAAATPDQRFVLKQSPLTYTQAATPTGRSSALQVTANGVKWKEVATLYGQPPSASVFSTIYHPDATTTVLFGDGVEGATLPTGQNNILARYRVGAGVDGNVAAGAITTLVDRPLGVSGVVNPSVATGGQDPQSVADIRTNAPFSTLTLGRAVSVADYRNFAAGFAGIAKADALWIASGRGRGVFLTVAAAGGVALPPGNVTLAKLIGALRGYGTPHIPIHAVSFLETLFSLAADIAFDPAYDPGAVQTAIVAALRRHYSFANRGFGQGVSGDEIAALVQAVPGVVAVKLTALVLGATSSAGDLASGGWSVYAYQQWLSQPVSLTRPAGDTMRICPHVPAASPDGLPLAAEILVLDPDPNAIALGVLS